MENTTTTSIALSDLSFGSKAAFYIGFLVKTAVLSGVFLSVFTLKKSICVNPGSEDQYLMFAFVLAGACLLYFVFYIISEGLLKQMFIGLLLSIVGAILSAIIPPLGLIIMVIGIISMIKQIIDLVKLIPMLLLGCLVCVCLFADDIMYAVGLNDLKTALSGQFFQLHVPAFTVPFIGLHFQASNQQFLWFNAPFVALSALIAVNLAFKYSLKNALFRVCVIFMSIPIMVLVFWLIKLTLRNIASSAYGLQGAVCSPQQMQMGHFNNGTIQVSGYTRANGTVVASYTRSLPRIG